MKKTVVILLCAGRSERFSGNKILAKIDGKTVLQTNLDNINACKNPPDEILIVQSDASNLQEQKLVSKIPLRYIIGGDSRTQSVQNALAVCNCQTVLIHDGARPFADAEIFDKCIEAASQFGSAIAVCRVVDTIKILDCGEIVTLDRNNLLAVQTPQGFDCQKLKVAYSKIGTQTFGDDSEVYEKYFGACKYFDAGAKNKKLTYADDLPSHGLRVGNGYDIHRLIPNRKLILGGIEVDYELGLDGHSDADVLVHAIIDALLSASGNPDIGRLFPDTDEKYRDANSLNLLQNVCQLIASQGFFVVNISAVIVCQSPKLSPYIDKMQGNLARILEIDNSNFGISAKTNEKLFEIGENKAICVYSHCLLAYSHW